MSRRRAKRRHGCRAPGPGAASCAAAILVIWTATTFGLACRAGEPAAAAAVEAAYLTKFAPFVTWPADALPTVHSPFVICVQGADPFDGILERLAAGQTIDAHPVVVRRLDSIDASSGCQIAYLGGSPAQSRAQAIRRLAATSVLTVTEDGGSSDDNGIVVLLVKDGRIRFAIDQPLAVRNGLQISSKLLALAVNLTR